MDDGIDIVKLVAGVFITGLVIGGIILGWIFVLGPLFNQADYSNFNSSPQHLQAVAQKFSDDCEQLAQEKDPLARKAIENDIYSVASTVNLNVVQMPDVTRTCVNKAMQDVSSGH